jgi:hypothetical protein
VLWDVNCGLIVYPLVRLRHKTTHRLVDGPARLHLGTDQVEGLNAALFETACMHAWTGQTRHLKCATTRKVD